MPLTVEERKARRVAGMKRAADELTEVQRIQRALTNGRPPAGELKTPNAAISAAKILYKELEARMKFAGLEPKQGDWGVSIGWVSTDLSLMGYSPLYSPGGEDDILKAIEGHIPIGLVFAMRDKEAADPKSRTAVGARPFFILKPQTDDWFETLTALVGDEIEYP